MRCACAIARTVRDLEIEARAGVHTGECEFTNGDIRGIAVNIASRIASLAGPSEVLASGTVRDLVVGSEIEFSQGEEVALKGVPGSWEVLAAKAPGSALLAP